jgi:hypothetical protein
LTPRPSQRISPQARQGEPKIGVIEEAVFNEIASDRNTALAQTALALARVLDAGAGMATAAVSKELRATLAELKAQHPKDEEPDVVDQLRAKREQSWETATAG